MPAQVTARRHNVEVGDAIEFCFAQGWTDGLPVVPPTPDRVARMLEGARLDPKQEIGFVAHRAVSITAEKVAINAVMAGCKPEFMPLVVAANEAESPWTPLHVERGFRADQSTVTVMAAEAPHQFYNQLSNTAEGVLTTLCDDMRISGNVMGQPHYALVLAGEHTRTITGDGWDKKRIRQFVWEHTQNSHAHLKRTGRMAGPIQPGDETKLRPLVASPDDILVVAAGGRAGAFSAYIPGWSSSRSSQAVTKEVRR